MERRPTMDYSWLLLLLTLLFSAAVTVLFAVAFHHRRRLPPGPPGLPYLGNIFLLGKPLSAIGHVVHRLALPMAPLSPSPSEATPFIFIAGHAAAHRALVAAGATFDDCPPPPAPRPISITSARYGPAWLLLRRNLVAEVLHPPSVRSYADARAWALRLLFDKLAAESEAGGSVKVGASFQLAMFSLFIFMCFGERMEEEQVRDVERVQRAMLLRVVQFNTFSFLLRFGKFLFRKRWKENQSIGRRQASSCFGRGGRRTSPSEGGRSRSTCYKSLLGPLGPQKDLLQVTWASLIPKASSRSKAFPKLINKSQTTPRIDVR